jgi:hypothetical protein
VASRHKDAGKKISVRHRGTEDDDALVSCQ